MIAVNEHHQTAYGMMPAPNLIASALIQRTKQGQDRDRRPRAAAGEQPGQHRRGVRDARQPVEGPHHHRVRARHRQRVSRDRHQSVFLARALPGGARPDRRGVDAARAVPVRGRALQSALRQPVAAALPEPHPPIWIPSHGLVRDDQLGGGAGAQVHVPGDVLRPRPGGALSQPLSRAGKASSATRPRATSSAGPPGLCRRHGRARARGGARRHGDACSTISWRCRGKC